MTLEFFQQVMFKSLILSISLTFLEKHNHLFISKTEKLIKFFELTMEHLHNKILLEYGPEITYTKNFLRIHGEDPVDSNHDELMRKYFDFSARATWGTK
jgi:hypothetical protein